MDINLHSFILVVGLIVILFIVIDGIKKVRESRANQFTDDLLDEDIIATEDQVFENHDEHSFHEFEIADDVVKGAFITGDDGNSVHLHAATPSDANEIPPDSSIQTSEHSQDHVYDQPAAELNIDSATENSEVNDHSVQTRDDNDDSEDSFVQGNTSEEFESLESFSAADYDSDGLSDPMSLGQKNEPYLAMEAEASQPQKTAPVKPTAPRKVNIHQPSKAEVENLKRELEIAQVKDVDVPDEEPLTDLPESVPVLMEPVELGGEVDPNPPLQQELHLPEFVKQTLADEPIIAEEIEPDFESFSIEDVDLVGEDVSLVDGDTLAVPPEVSTKNATKALPVGEKLSERPPAQEIFVINVLNEHGPMLKGNELHHIFKVCDMRHGEMEIFHRFEKANGQGKIQFSVVNALKPGTFDLATIDAMETKGISMFMSLPGPEDAMGAFDAMAEVALVFAKNFGASLYDESHSDLTPQTLEHYRNRIREYSRKHFSRK